VRFDDQRIRHQFPKILNFNIHEVVFFAQALHDHVTTVVARSNDELCARVFDLLRFDPTVEGSFFDVRSRPGAAACTAAEIVGPVGIHIDEALAALLRDPTGFLVITMAEHPLTLTAVVAGIMNGSQLVMDGFIQLDTSFLDVFFQEIVNAKKLDAFVGKPFLQTKPGRIVCVPSLG